MTGRSRLLTVVVSVAALGALAGACGDGVYPGAEAFTVRDSAGIGIVESADPAWGEGEAWAVEPEPVLSLGSIDGGDAYAFVRVRDATRLPDGRVIVADNGASEVRVFDAEGQHLWTRGGRGRGPGEFSWLERVLVGPGDTLYALNTFPGRASVFAPDGSFVRDWPLEGLGTPIRLLSEGRILNRTSRTDGTEGHQVWWTSFLVHGPDGTVDTLLSRIPGGESYLVRQGNGVSNMEVHFGRTSSAAATSGRIFAGDGDGYEVAAYDLEGRLVSLVRRSIDPVPVTEADVRRLIDIELEPYPDDRRAEVRETMEEAPARETMPAYDRMLADGTGHLWVRRYRPPWEEGPPVWDVFGPDGRWLGPVELPADLRVFQIGEDHLLGLHRDELDVERVRVHRLVR